MDVDIDVGENVFIRHKIVLTENAVGQLALIDNYRIYEGG
jgi:hypothetical protein